MTEAVEPDDEAGWFSSDYGPVFGVLGHPVGGACMGAVLCPPVGIDLQSSYAAVRALSRDLNKLGVATIRFDYVGTGNSAGNFGDSQVATWLDGVRRANQVLLDAGVETTVLVGLRLGANLAARASSGLSGLAGLVLWDPYKDGSSFLREQRAMLSFGSSDPGRSSMGTSTETAGYVYPDALASQVKSIGLSAKDLAAVPTLLLGRRRVADSFRRAAGHSSDCEVKILDEDAEGRMLAPSVSASRVPKDTVAQITDWIAAQVPGDLKPSLVRPSLKRAIEISSVAGTVQEEVFRFGSNNLFGIRSSGTSATSGLRRSVIFVNSADGHNIGPCRLWVDLARLCSSDGISSVRFDVSGTGESEARPPWPSNTVFAPSAVHDVRAALHAGMVSADAIVLVGLCSGGYLVSEVAFKTDVSRFLVLNAPFHMRVPEQKYNRIDEVRSLLLPRRKFIEANRARVKVTNRTADGTGKRCKLLSLERFVWRLLDVTRVQPSPARSILRLGTVGRQGRMIYGADEMTTVLRGASNKLLRQIQETNVSVEKIEHLDHGLWDASSRALVTEALRRELSGSST